MLDVFRKDKILGRLVELRLLRMSIGFVLLNVFWISGVSAGHDCSRCGMVGALLSWQKGQDGGMLVLR